MLVHRSSLLQSLSVSNLSTVKWFHLEIIFCEYAKFQLQVSDLEVNLCIQNLNVYLTDELTFSSFSSNHMHVERDLSLKYNC